jgi:hypothetical protein
MAMGLVPKTNTYDVANTTDPQKLQAYVAQQQYANYLDTYRPVEDFLFNRLSSWDDFTSQQASTNMYDAGRAFQNAQDSYARQTRSYGLQLSPEQQKSVQRRFDLSAALSAVNAGNRTKQNMDDAKYQLGFGYSPYGVQ